MTNILKTILLFTISGFIGFCIFILGYMYIFHQSVTILNPLLPVTHFSLENAPQQSLKGEVASYSGNVAWISRTAVVSSLIKSKIKIGQGEEIIAQGNGTATLIFPVGILIQMESNSNISIIQTLPVSIVIAQDKGTVSYKNTNNKIPLSVNGLDLLISMSQGICQISVDKENANVVINVSSGFATAVFIDNENNTQTKTIESGREMDFNNNTKQATVEVAQ
jgi:hypothetical protein